MSKVPEPVVEESDRALRCATCQSALTAESAMSQDPDGCLVPYEQATAAYAELPPLKNPIDKNDPRDTAVRICRTAIPLCLPCAKRLFNSEDE
jgi:hypothetical protein